MIMAGTSFFRFGGILTAIVLVSLGGCLGKSQSARFYALTPLTYDQTPASAEGAGRNAAVGIGPIKLADYLDQSKIVIRTSNNQLERAEYDQWAGSLKENLANVLADNLGFLLPTEHIFIFPWRSAMVVDYQVVLDIVQFDGSPGKDIQLIARWRLVAKKEKQLLAVKRFSVRESVASEDYTAMVAAQSRALAELSREIAETIHAVAGK